MGTPWLNAVTVGRTAISGQEACLFRSSTVGGQTLGEILGIYFYCLHVLLRVSSDARGIV